MTWNGRNVLFVCNVQVPWSYRLEYFEYNFTAE